MTLTRIILLACAFLVADVSSAARPPARKDSSPSREAFFRCRDAQGQTHYGDSMPPECLGLDTEVLNDRGTVLRIIEGDASRAASAAQKAAEDAKRKEREAAAKRDAVLIETYLTVQDIERLRDQRLELLQAQVRVAEQNLRSLRERESRLKQQVARYRPYSDKPNAPPLPDHLAEELVNTVNGMEVHRQTVIEKQAEQDELTARFDSDIRRFKELKGIK